MCVFRLIDRALFRTGVVASVELDKDLVLDQREIEHERIELELELVRRVRQHWLEACVLPTLALLENSLRLEKVVRVL